MTRDEIAQMMQDSSGMDWGTEAHFQRFAALVAAAEREACAKVCEMTYEGAFEGARPCFETPDQCADAIRARGQA
jgi:hypothetical protein